MRTIDKLNGIQTFNTFTSCRKHDSSLFKACLRGCGISILLLMSMVGSDADEDNCIENMLVVGINCKFMSVCCFAAGDWNGCVERIVNL